MNVITRLVVLVLFIIVTAVCTEIVSNGMGVELEGSRIGRIAFYVMVLLQGMGIQFILRYK